MSETRVTRKQLARGIQVSDGELHRLVVVEPRLIIRLQVDPSDPRFAQARFILRSSKDLCLERTVADDKKPGDEYLDLEFWPIQEEENYSLYVRLTETASETALFEEISYSKLHHMMMGVEHGK